MPKKGHRFMLPRRHAICVMMFITLAPWTCAEPLRFSALGCGPYKAEEEAILEKQIEQVGADGKSEFLVHLGDIVSGAKKYWPEAQYAKVAGILRNSKVPTFVVLGDNEYNDLDNPAEGLQ